MKKPGTDSQTRNPWRVTPYRPRVSRIAFGPKASPIKIPPAAARRFFEDMFAFFRETDRSRQEEIAARQLLALSEYTRPRDQKLRLVDVKELFERMKDDT